MSSVNHTSLHPASVHLIGIPGLEALHSWISIPFCLMYMVALLGNSLLLLVIATDRSLCTPMHLFLALLAAADILLSTCAMPTTLSVLWAGSMEISFSTCLVQMFFLYFIYIAESGILLAMAFDRYIAICDPLRYPLILTHTVIGKIALAALTKGFCTMFPVVFLLRRLPYCGHTVVFHTYCEHMGIARLACTDIVASMWYGFATSLILVGLDTVLIAVSYILILRAVFRLPSKNIRLKAIETCGSHMCVILIFYIPAFFSWYIPQFDPNVPSHTSVLLANLYVVIPPMLNPIIYGVRTKLIKERVARLLSQPVKRC